MRIEPKKVLERLDHARARALEGDAEGIHHVRAASRRLRVWLDFRGQAKLQEELRWVCGALARVRDLDVFDEVLTAEARVELRPRAVAIAVEALESTRWKAMREELEGVRPPKSSQAKRALRRLERQLEKRRAALSPGDGTALHRLRRALRRLRYAREWLDLDVKELAAEQDRLGAVCDLLALQAFAHRHHVEPPRQLAEGVTAAFEAIAVEE